MKFTSTICLILIITVNSFCQSDSVTFLSCNTWGEADWSRLEQHYGYKFPTTGGVIREYDRNIRGIYPVHAEAYGGNVFLRWILNDTTIHYDITIKNEHDELIFSTTSNKCGIHIPFGLLRQENVASMLHITVERNNKRSGIYWGIEFVVDEARPAYRKRIEEELPEVLAKVRPEERVMAATDYFVTNKWFADALYTLELAVREDPGNANLKKKFWITVNEMFIDKSRR